MSVAELVHVSCDRCPWQITDQAAVVAEARREHAVAHLDAGRHASFTESPVESEEPEDVEPSPAQPSPARTEHDDSGRHRG